MKTNFQIGIEATQGVPISRLALEAKDAVGWDENFTGNNCQHMLNAFELIMQLAARVEQLEGE